MFRGELRACGNELGGQALLLLAGLGQQFSVDGAPVAAVTWHQPPSDEQNKVDKPPDAESSEC